jgi:hypothetical protein
MKAHDQRVGEWQLDAIDVLFRVGCQFFACRGPLAPFVHMATCCRCATLNRAWRLGLVSVDEVRRGTLDKPVDTTVA